ncbi:MAG: DUF1906 domain-containing protein [Acidobacteriia bacterium]|nr:DUF1906 domain-containing protein [Terriglobia bacterium]
MSLKLKDSGPEVVELQNLLNQNGEVVVVDGIFGNETLAAVKDFQSKHSDADGNPLSADGVAGPLTLASLKQGAVPAPVVASGSFAGFDLGTYPGDSQMKTWVSASPYRFFGYYLESPFHPDTSFMGKRAALQGMGWGLAVLYVGRQESSRPENQTRARGISDGTDTITKTRSEGFAAGTVVYLDIEPMDVIPAGIKDYLKGWISQMIASPFQPGIYCHIKNAKELRASALEEMPGGSKPAPMFWVSGSGHFDPGTSVPSGSGIPFATIWQGLFEHTETHGGVTLTIDVNVANSPNPSIST